MASPVSRPQSSTSRILTVFFLLIVLAIAWFLAPFFLPVWRWRHVDFREIAREKKVDEKLLRQEYEITFRYAPRGGNDADPCPFQIVTMSPTWVSQDEENRTNEENLLVRCSILSDKTGGIPNRLFIGNTFRDRYFKAKAWRFPPETFGKPPGRPVIVYEALSLDKLDISAADNFDREIRLTAVWQNDDDWPERDDGWDPAAAAAAAAEAAAAAADAPASK